MWSAICDKVFECTEHNADRNSSSAVPDLWPRTAWRTTDLLQEFSWEEINHPPYSPDLAPSDFRLFLFAPEEIPVRSAYSEWQRGGDECYSGSNPRRQTSTTQGYKSVCVCVPMPTHCTITRFGFRARRIDDVECGLFSNHATLGQTTLRVGWISV